MKLTNKYNLKCIIHKKEYDIEILTSFPIMNISHIFRKIVRSRIYKMKKCRKCKTDLEIKCTNLEINDSIAKPAFLYYCPKCTKQMPSTIYMKILHEGKKIDVFKLYL